MDRFLAVRYLCVTGGVSVDWFLVVHAPQTLIKGDFVSLYLFIYVLCCNSVCSRKAQFYVMHTQ